MVLKSRLYLYTVDVKWTGNLGQGTSSYRAYNRTWDLCSPGKPVVACSNDPLLGGNPAQYNPEDMLIGALSACHMLWFLHLASDAGIVVEAYEDHAEATGETLPNGASRFLEAVLCPVITLQNGNDPDKADGLHKKVHDFCFIARSVNFPVRFAAKYLFA